MDLTKALDFLEKQGLADCHYQDSGMMEHIAENMQKYADQQLILSGVVSCVCKIPEPRLKVSENGTHAYCNNCAKTYLQK